MEIKFNKVFSILLASIMILNYALAQTLILLFIDLTIPDSSYEIAILDILATSVISILDNLNKLVIGFWLYTMAQKFHQDKWSWFVMGLAFGPYALILLLLLQIVQGIKLRTELVKTLSPLLILLIISFFLNPVSRFVIRPYLLRILDLSDYSFSTEYSFYFVIFNYGIVILLNIVLGGKLYKFMGQLRIKGKVLWTVSTVFLGLFPVILFNEFLVTKADDTSAG